MLCGVLLFSGLGFQFFGHGVMGETKFEEITSLGRSEKWADIGQELVEANQRLAAEPARGHRPSTRVSYREEDEIIEP